MNASILRLPLRLAVPVIALAALVIAGEPIATADHTALITAPEQLLACDDAPLHDADAIPASEQRSRTAMRLRWALTLPDSTRPLSIGLTF